MPLSHVCIWDKKIGYRRITADEASQMFPKETVNVFSGFFRCELCGQPVGFSKAREDTGSRYFYHSRGEEDKSCEDRQSSYDSAMTSLSSHTLPLHITVKDYAINLEIGFFMPSSTDSTLPECEKIKIKGVDDPNSSYEYAFERINRTGVTYLSVGYKPSRKYLISYVAPNKYIHTYWPREVPGVEPRGALFDCNSGVMIQPCSKVYPRREYYLLSKKRIGIDGSISVLESREFRVNNYYTWRVYRIQAKSFCEDAAKFFLQFAVFLTEDPVSFTPIWPVTVRAPYFYYHQGYDMYFYLHGNGVELRSFPAIEDYDMPKSDGAEGGMLYKIFAPQREQLLSLGSSGALGFAYLLRKELDMQADVPSVAVNDINGITLASESYDRLPKGRQINIIAPYDGRVELLKHHKLSYVYRLQPDVRLTVESIDLGTTVLIYQGCDLVRSISFIKGEADDDKRTIDAELVVKLRKSGGRLIPLSHSVGALVDRLKRYPETMKWLRRAIQSGYISESAFKLLVSFSNFEGV